MNGSEGDGEGGSREPKNESEEGGDDMIVNSGR